MYQKPTKKKSITSSRVYETAIQSIRTEAALWFRNTLNGKTPQRIPKGLVTMLSKQLDRDASLEEVKKGVSVALSDICVVDDWTEGIDDDGSVFVQFYLIPEKLREY